MDFQNRTPFPAFLHRQAVAGDRIAAAAIARATFQIGEPCTPTRTQPWLVTPTPWVGPCGRMPSDDVFDREGCDLLLLGEAASPNAEPATEVDVSIQVGAFSARVRVFGDRTWVRQGERLVPTSPAPFIRIPLDLERGYGGVASYDELAVPFAENPGGRGFYLEEELAEGGLLPNIEDPDNLIRAWDDRPEPVGAGICPPGFPPRVRAAAVVREGRVVAVRRSIHNMAFPRFVCPSVAAGEVVTVRGMGPDLAFQLPTEPVVAFARIGEVEHRDPLRIDQIGVEPARQRFFVTYRYTFIYPLRRGDLRRCELRWTPPPGLAPPAPLPEVQA